MVVTYEFLVFCVKSALLLIGLSEVGFLRKSAAHQLANYKPIARQIPRFSIPMPFK